MKKIVVFTGAGVSQESGLDTYRDKGGLWEKYKPEIYASVQGWNIQRDKLLDFYDLCRTQLAEVEPNPAHQLITELENDYQVTVITQNVDDLHERAGSSNIIHLHGELTKIRRKQEASDSSQWIDIGHQPLDRTQYPKHRPAIVLFGEDVPMMKKALYIVQQADALVVVGTSLQVYPAAGLLEHLPLTAPLMLIDPHTTYENTASWEIVKEKASVGMTQVKPFLKREL